MNYNPKLNYRWGIYDKNKPANTIEKTVSQVYHVWTYNQTMSECLLVIFGEKTSQVLTSNVEIYLFKMLLCLSLPVPPITKLSVCTLADFD